MSTITIVVLVYNAGPYLLPCLESVAAQTHDAFEAIVVDNGSSDGSGTVCDAFAAQDGRFRVFHGENLGNTGGRAAGLAVANGEYVCFLDGDDLLHPRFLELLQSACVSSGLPVACCEIQPFEGAAPIPSPSTPAPLTLLAPTQLDALLHDKRVEYSLCNKLYRRELFENVPFCCPVTHNEDLYLNWHILQNVPGLALIELQGYFYRQHPVSLSHRPLAAETISDQLWVAGFIRDSSRGGAMEESAQAYYYEKLLYLDSMILRRADASSFAPQHKMLRKELGEELFHALRQTRLPMSLKLAALLACRCEPLYALLCRTLLTDRR